MELEQMLYGQMHRTVSKKNGNHQRPSKNSICLLQGRNHLPENDDSDHACFSTDTTGSY